MKIYNNKQHHFPFTIKRKTALMITYLQRLRCVYYIHTCASDLLYYFGMSLTKL